jgi:hypothetical protein
MDWHQSRPLISRRACRGGHISPSEWYLCPWDRRCQAAPSHQAARFRVIPSPHRLVASFRQLRQGQHTVPLYARCASGNDTEFLQSASVKPGRRRNTFDGTNGDSWAEKSATAEIGQCERNGTNRRTATDSSQGRRRQELLVVCMRAVQGSAVLRRFSQNHKVCSRGI